MAIRDEIRILTSNTLEEFRQKSNELSIDKVGDNKLLSSNITDKTYDFTATASQKHFEISGRFEVLPEQTIDRTTGVAEAFRTGTVRVKSDGTELVQGLLANQFIVPNYSLKVTLTGSPTIPAEFVENAVLTQSNGFSGVLLSADSTTLRFKSFTGTLSTTANLGIPHTDSLKNVVAGNISSKTDIDPSHGILIELITAASVGDSIQVIATSLVDAINELQDDIGITENLTTSASNTVLAINEHDAELGTITSGAMGTSASTVSTAIAEHEGQIGNMSLTGLSATDLSEGLRELRTELGNHAALGTTSTTSAVSAINELETAIRGSASNYTITTAANDLVAAINELDALQGNTDISAIASTVTAALSQLHTEIGDVSITTIASGNNTITGALAQLHTELGSATLGTSANTHTGAINELHGEINSNDTDIGNVMSLIDGSSTVDSSISFTGLSATNLKTAIEEVVSEKLNITNATAGGQSLSGNINYTAASGNGTFDFGTGTVLDISDGTLLVSAAGGVANFGSAFINLDGEIAQMGLQVDRDYIAGANDHDVRLQWNESLVSSTPERAWQLVGMNDSGFINTADIVTFYNAQDLISNNTETGISVTWDASNQNFDFALTADPVITLGGDLTGNTTLTNLTSATLTATIAAGSVENSMLAGSIAASKLAGSIPNNKLTNTGISIDAQSGTTHQIDLGETLTVTGQSGEIETSILNNTLTIGLPSNVTIGNNLIVTGDLTVQGTNTILNTSTLEVEDTLILAGSNLGATEPTTGGFGLETRPFAGVHANAASGVTGAHSIVYNFATDRWEADGSLILSSATLSTPEIEGVSFGPGDNLTFTAGSGLSESVTGFAVTYVNTDKGSSQNIFKNVAADSGGTATANINNDTLTISGGSSLTTVRSGDTITVNHSSTGAPSVNNAGNTYIQDLTIDSNGHVTAVASSTIDTYSGWNLTVGGTARGNISETEVVSFAAGTALTVGYSATNNVITFNHADTSSVLDINASGTTFVQDLTFDTHGHVTAASTGTFTLGNGQLTVQGTGVLGGSGTFTANQTGAGTISITHDAVSKSSTTSTATPGYGSSFTAIDSITTSPEGHVTAVNTKTVTIPASDNTNTLPNNGTITISAGSGLSGGAAFTTDQSANETITLAHADTSSQASSNNSGRTYIQDITLDTYGHVTGIGTATETVVNTDTTYTAGTGMSLSGTTFNCTVVDTNTVTSNVAGNGISVSAATGSSTIAMSGSYTGTFTASADVVAYSDKKLKDNVETLDGSKVFDMRGVSFNRNDQDGKLSSGVIAQELEMIAPELIHEAEDGTKGVAYGNTVGYLIEAIKLLKAEIEELKSINKKV
jgi:hypothetical protein